jgi:hypothetical protein
VEVWESEAIGTRGSTRQRRHLKQWLAEGRVDKFVALLASAARIAVSRGLSRSIWSRHRRLRSRHNRLDGCRTVHWSWLVISCLRGDVVAIIVEIIVQKFLLGLLRGQLAPQGLRGSGLRRR